jgi:hypothetical protein
MRKPRSLKLFKHALSNSSQDDARLYKKFAQSAKALFTIVTVMRVRCDGDARANFRNERCIIL